MCKDILAQIEEELNTFARVDQMEILKSCIQERLLNNLQSYSADLTATSNRLIKSQALVKTNRALNR